MILIDVELFNFQIAVVPPCSHSVSHSVHQPDEARAIKKDRFGLFSQSGPFKNSYQIAALLRTFLAGFCFTFNADHYTQIDFLVKCF